MTIQLTEHARSRLQQRGIPALVLDCLLAYGRKVHDHRGGEVIFFDHHSRAQLRCDRGDAIQHSQHTRYNFPYLIKISRTRNGSY